MKKYFIFIFCVLLIIVLATISGCKTTIQDEQDSNQHTENNPLEDNDNQESDNGDNHEEDNLEDDNLSDNSSQDALPISNVDLLAPSEIRITEPNEKVSIMKSFTDGEYNFYFFDLGTIRNVPLGDLNSCLKEFRNYGQTQEIEFTHTSVQSSTITTSMTSTMENAFSIGVETGISITFGGDNPLLNSALNFAFSCDIENSNSLQESYNDAQSFSETQTERVKFAFDKNAADGFYGYALTGDLQVYATVINSIDGQEKYIDYSSKITNYWEAFYYFSSADEFTNYDIADKINFNIPGELPTPSIYKQRNPVSIELTNVVTSIVGSSLSQAAIYCLNMDKHFNMSNLKKNSYNSCSISIEFSVDEIDNGYQEFYIATGAPTGDSGNYLAFKNSKILFSARDIETDSNYHKSFNITVPNLINDNINRLYFVWGAHGDYSDWWRLHNVNITIAFSGGETTDISNEPNDATITIKDLFQGQVNDQNSAVFDGCDAAVLFIDPTKLLNYNNLVASGYNSVYIQVDFQIKTIEDGYREIYISKDNFVGSTGSGRNFKLLFNNTPWLSRTDLPSSGTGASSTEKLNLSEIENGFYIIFSARGNDSDRWQVNDCSISLVFDK